jgi:XTP/dITP diphosphohydrolase
MVGMRDRVVLATRSEGKLRELRPLLEAGGWQACTLADVGVDESPDEAHLEVHDTFEDNARAKARYFARVTGLPVLADDSGLVVDLLGGRPGVRSKRWAGREELSGAWLDAANNAALLDAMAVSASRTDTSDGRTAHYVCVAVWADRGREWIARGETHGRILTAPRGTGGFGYDPLFWSDELGATFAEADREAKGAVSHRGRAVRAVLERVLHQPPDEIP